MGDQPIIKFNRYNHNLDIHQVEKDLKDHQGLWEDVIYEILAGERFGHKGFCEESLVLVARPNQGKKLLEMAKDWNPDWSKWANGDQKITLAIQYEDSINYLERDILYLTWRR